MNPSEPKFVPKGAIAFFVALLVFFAAIWMGFYLLMLHRHGNL